MSDKPKVVDGADRRRARMLELLMFIHNSDGATTQDIKGFMLMKFGLRYKTTAEYIQELHLSRLITQGGASDLGKWFITKNYRRWAKYLYSE